MFSFENGPNIEAVPSASEFFGNTPNVWDSDRTIICFIRGRTVASPWLHHGINKFLWVFIKYQIMSCVLNFSVEIVPVLTYDLGSTDQAMNDSSFHVVGVVGLNM
jgi:hypothetical protein